MKKRIFTLLILCIPLTACARIHTILNSDTIAMLQSGESDAVEYIPVKGKHKRGKGKNKYPYKKYALHRNKKYKEIITAAAKKHNVDEKLVHAVIQAESAYNPAATSYKGAVGLMQLMPDTAKRFGCDDRNDPVKNVNGGTKYLKYLITLFDSNLPLVVAAYNAGENAVIRHNNKIPPYPDTKEYVRQVLSIYKAS